MNMLNITKGIYDILINDVTVYGLVEDKIFPNIIPDKDDEGEKINSPAIVIDRVNIATQYTKSLNGCSVDEALVQLTIWADSYIDAVNIAMACRSVLDFTKGTFNGVLIDRVRLIEASEEFSKPLFAQILTFNIK